MSYMVPLERRSTGELTLFGSSANGRLTLAVMWIGLERMFSTPAIAAIEVDGEEVFKDFGRHGAEIDGGTIDESVAFDITPEVLRRMIEGTRVVVRIDELRLTLQDPHGAMLRTLWREVSPAPATPRVTVLIPVFNRERFVDEAIRSVLAQDFTDFELVVVDDGSTDATPQVLASWARRDPRVVVVGSPVNQGIPAALNLGLAHARGAYVARLDSDDLMLPGRLAGQAAVLDARPDVALVSCAYEIVDDAGGEHLGTWRVDEPHEVIAFLLNFFNLLGGGGQMMFRLADVREEGGYAVEYPSSEDYDLWVRLARRGRIEVLPLTGMRKRRHGSQSLSRYGGIKRANWRGIMRGSLERYLRRAVSDEEIDALITVWRQDGRLGMAATADRVMREALARFAREHGPLHKRARRRIARQWLAAARGLARSGHPLEALRFMARAIATV